MRITNGKGSSFSLSQDLLPVLNQGWPLFSLQEQRGFFIVVVGVDEVSPDEVVGAGGAIGISVMAVKVLSP